MEILQGLLDNLTALLAAHPLAGVWYMAFVRFLFPALAVLILYRAVRSLLRIPHTPENWGQLSLPNGTSLPLTHWENILGRSPAVSAMREIIATVAPTEATVLITGESGTGKELVARAVHGASARANKPLVTVNCAALAENLLESELFGHERGAFTGADRRREGRFLQADGGTLFLDEIGEMPLSLQAKLLRALQQGEVQRVGSDSPITVDVRVIAATNRNLREEVEQKRFREDLFFRLNVISIEVPALRERSEDIPLLAAHFLEKFAARNRKNVKGFAPQALDMLRRAMLGLPVEMEA